MKFVLIFALSLLLGGTSFSQDEEVEYDTLNISGSQEEVVEEDFEQGVETKTKIEAKEEANEEASQALENAEKKSNSDLNEANFQDFQEEKEVEPVLSPVPVVPAEIPEEEITPEKNTKFYSFLFDNSKKALFETEAQWKNYVFGLGGFWFFPGRYQKSSTGGKYTPDPEITLEFGLEFGDVGSWSFIPHVFLSNPTKSEDSFLTQYHYGLGIDSTFTPWSFFRFRLGTTFLFTTIKGKDTKLVSLPGDQGDFFINSGARTAINNTIDLGLEWLINDFSISTEAMVVSAFESEKRDYVYGLFIRYYFGMGAKKVEKNLEGDVIFKEDKQNLTGDIEKEEVPIESLNEVKVNEEKELTEEIKEETLERPELEKKVKEEVEVQEGEISEDPID